MVYRKCTNCDYSELIGVEISFGNNGPKICRKCGKGILEEKEFDGMQSFN